MSILSGFSVNDGHLMVHGRPQNSPMLFALVILAIAVCLFGDTFASILLLVIFAMAGPLFKPRATPKNVISREPTPIDNYSGRTRVSKPKNASTISREATTASNVSTSSPKLSPDGSRRRQQLKNNRPAFENMLDSGAENDGVNYKINSMICNAHTPDEILSVVEKRVEEFNLLNIVTVCYRLAKRMQNANYNQTSQLVSDSRFQSVLRSIPRCLKSEEKRMNGVLSNLFWAIAKLKVFSKENDIDQIICMMCEAACEDVEIMEPQEMSSVIWAISVIMNVDRRPIPYGEVNLFTGASIATREVVTKTFVTIAKHSCEKIEKFRAQEISNCAVALCRAFGGYSSFFCEGKLATHENEGLRQLFTFLLALSKASIDSINKLEPQHVANIIWAFVKMQMLPKPDIHELLTVGIKEAVSQRVSYRLKPQEAANIVWSMARAGVKCDQEVTMLACLMSKNNFRGFNSQDFANWAWAYTTMRETFDSTAVTFFSAMGKASMNMLSSFTPQELGNYLWAYAKSGTAPANHMLFRAASSVIMRTQPRRFSSPSLANMVWSYGVSGVDEPYLWMTLLEEMQRRFDRGEMLRPIEVSNVSWALGTISWSPFRGNIKLENRLIEGLTASLPSLRRNNGKSNHAELTTTNIADIIFGLSKASRCPAVLFNKVVKLLNQHIQRGNGNSLPDNILGKLGMALNSVEHVALNNQSDVHQTFEGVISVVEHIHTPVKH